LQVFEQIKAQEQTKQAELKTKEAEFRVQAEQAAIVSALAAARAVAVQHRRSLASRSLPALIAANAQTATLGGHTSWPHPAHPARPPPCCSQAHERVKWEEQRKAMQQDAQQKAQLAQYQDELARKRAESEHEKQRVRNVELVQLQVREGARWNSWVLGC
jgi:hypothetical protein